jgi:hypothetical protein
MSKNTNVTNKTVSTRKVQIITDDSQKENEKRLHPPTEQCSGIANTSRTHIVHDLVAGAYIDVATMMCTCRAEVADRQAQQWKQVVQKRNVSLHLRDQQELEEAWQACERLGVHLYDNEETRMHYTVAQRMALSHYRVMESMVERYKKDGEEHPTDQ